MELEQIIGVFCATPKGFETGLPPVPEQTLWQIALYTDGILRAVPLDENYQPGDKIIDISPEMFAEGFAPVGILGKQANNFSADDPELVWAWYGKKTGQSETERTSEGSAHFMPSTPPGVASPQHFAETSSGAEPSPAMLDASGVGPAKPTSLDTGFDTRSVQKKELLPQQAHWNTAQDMQILELSMRRQFNSLLEQLRRGDQAEAAKNLEQLIKTHAPYTWKQKYMFSEFGLAFRKEGQYQLAQLCHQRALEISPHDENVLFNIARAEFELGNIEAAKSYLNTALQVAPDFQAARNFLIFLSGQ